MFAKSNIISHYTVAVILMGLVIAEVLTLQLYGVHFTQINRQVNAKRFLSQSINNAF